MSGKENNHTGLDFGTFAKNDFHSVLKQLLDAFVNAEKRGEIRTPRSLKLTVQPLDLDFQPDGEPFDAITRDISANGMGFIYAEPLRHEFIRITMPDQTQGRVIARVRYNLSIGTNYPLYLVGVQFLN